MISFQRIPGKGTVHAVEELASLCGLKTRRWEAQDPDVLGPNCPKCNRLNAERKRDAKLTAPRLRETRP